MKKSILILFSSIIFSATLSSCVNSLPAQTRLQSSNPGATVELLFEVDGCKVYRFYDKVNGNSLNASPRYFTKCQNGSSSVGWLESCGKNCVYYAENVTSYPANGIPVKP